MNKSFFLALTAVGLLSACSTVHNQGTASANIAASSVEVRPLEASLKVGAKTTGEATCKSLFGIAYSGPDHEAYGATLEESAGNVAPSKCTRGAVYEALNKTDSDVLVAPTYEVDAKNTFCIPFVDACAYRRASVKVKGYGANYTNIKEMDKDVVKERQKNIVKEAPKATFSAGNPLNFLFN